MKRRTEIRMNDLWFMHMQKKIFEVSFYANRALCIISAVEKQNKHTHQLKQTIRKKNAENAEK